MWPNCWTLIGPNRQHLPTQACLTVKIPLCSAYKSTQDGLQPAPAASVNARISPTFSQDFFPSSTGISSCLSPVFLQQTPLDFFPAFLQIFRLVYRADVNRWNGHGAQFWTTPVRCGVIFKINRLPAQYGFWRWFWDFCISRFLASLCIQSLLLNSPYTWESNLGFNIYGCLRRNLWMSPLDFLRFKRHNLGGASDILQFRSKIPLFTGTAIVGSNSNTSRTSGGQDTKEGAP